MKKLLSLVASLLLGAATPAQHDHFPTISEKIAVFGDTQWWANSHAPQNLQYLSNAAEYVASNYNRIKFVAFVGDLVEQGQLEADWQLFYQGIGPLVAEDFISLTWNTCLGNHDFDRGANYAASGAAGSKEWTNFNKYTGLTINERAVITIDGQDILFIFIEWHPTDDSLEFAANLLEANPQTPAILVTHAWTTIDLTTETITHDGGQPYVNNRKGDNNPLNAYRKLSDNHPQIIGVFSGHGPIPLTNPNTGNRLNFLTRKVTPLHGQDQFEYQINTNSDPGTGGYGYIGLVELDKTNDLIRFEMVSNWPTNQIPAAYRRAENRTLPFGLSTRYPWLLTANRNFWWLRNSDDTYIEQGAPTSIKNGQKSVGVSHDTGAARNRHALLKFDLTGVTGTVEQAILTIYTGTNWWPDPTTPIAVDAYVMSTTVGGGQWSPNATWNSKGTVGGDWTTGGAGVTPGSECAASPTFTVTSDKTNERTTWAFDVTTEVNAWLTGTDNNGWAFIQQAHSGSINSWSFRTYEWGTSPVYNGTFIEQPTLYIVTTP